VSREPNQVSGEPDLAASAESGQPLSAEAADSGGPQDLLPGLLSALLGVAVLVHVRGYPELPDGQPGPALFPGIVGALFVLFGLILVLRAVLARRRAVRTVGGAQTSETADTGDRSASTTARGRLDALAVLGSVVAYLLLAEPLGFMLTMGGLLFLLTWRLGARPVTALVAAVLTTGIIVLIFEKVLLVPLPPGLLG
jgi:putative tricarboxylic transport membrane protein